MYELLFFIFGLVIGGLIGITIMCILQINRLNDNKQIRDYISKNEKKNN